jgi:Domain of unknown function (DUF4375)
MPLELFSLCCCLTHRWNRWRFAVIFRLTTQQQSVRQIPRRDEALTRQGPSPGLDLEATIWNGFVELLALSTAEELTPEQRPAQLVFWYQAEVLNGGHLQYFLNRGSAEAHEAIKALEAFGATEHASLLAEAVQEWTSVSREESTSVEEYVDLALEAEFDRFDQKSWSLRPLQEVLKECLHAKQDLFVDVRIA